MYYARITDLETHEVVASGKAKNWRELLRNVLPGGFHEIGKEPEQGNEPVLHFLIVEADKINPYEMAGSIKEWSGTNISTMGIGDEVESIMGIVDNEFAAYTIEVWQKRA